MMRRNAVIFQYICRASQELNKIFSFPVLILLTAKFISAVTVAFAYIYNRFVHSDVMLDSHSMSFLFTFLADWIQILVLLTAADMPVDEVSYIKSTEIY